MQTKRRELFTTVRTEGAILPADLLQRVAEGDGGLEGLRPEDYHLSGEKLNEAINRAWNRLLGAWKAFHTAREKLPETDPATSPTREKWLLPLFRELDYGRLPVAKAVEIEGKSYAISHAWEHAPVHLLGWAIDLDRRTRGVAGAATTSPHSMVQEYLNRSEDCLWAFLSNGRTLRILRDNISLTRQAFVEFDLQAMMDGEVYADFALLWLVCHQSRVEAERPEQCWLEKWSHAAQERGTRALDQLRGGVEEAIKALGRGFLVHPNNPALRDKLYSGTLAAQDYYRQLLRMVYRLLFLFVAEDRDLLLDPNADEDARERYTSYYSTARLRRLAERHRGTQHGDLYHGLILVMEKLGSEEGCPELGLPALGSLLWSEEAIADLVGCHIANTDLLAAVRELAFTVDGNVLRVVDYKNLGAEELGSIYESLLELHPEINQNAGTFELGTAAGHERKSTGSYYTPTSLITRLMDSALEPLITEAANKSTTEHAEQAILDLKVCDPACGSGHFLIAAAYRIGKRLAAVRTGDDEPAPNALRHAVREVIGHCIFGVDVNPMAVELCKINLWLESLEPGKPLSFLDHHIQCGNSLLGATPVLLAEGIPDEAFKSIGDDDKSVCNEMKRANRDERRGQKTFDFEGRGSKPWERLGDLAASVAQLDEADDATVANVRSKQERYEKLVNSSGYLFGRLWADAWCAAFVWRKTKQFDYGITEEVFRQIERNPHSIAPWMRAEIQSLAQQYRFFHWHLAFPQVFRVASSPAEAEDEQTRWNGGFDVVLGNPPFVGGLKISELYGSRLRHLLNNCFTNVKGKADLCSLMFRRGYETLAPNGRIGMVATNTIAQGQTRETGLAHILCHGGHIRWVNRYVPWPGSANVEVTLLAISKTDSVGPAILDDVAVPSISSRLDSLPEAEPSVIPQNRRLCFQGSIVLGKGFILDNEEAADILTREPDSAQCLYPYLTGEDINTHPSHEPSRWVIQFDERTEHEARKHCRLWSIAEDRIWPERQGKDARKYPRMVHEWWKHWNNRHDLYRKVRPLKRALGRSRVSEFHMLAWVRTDIVYSDACVVFAIDDDLRFAILQSGIHEVWLRREASTMRTDIRYTPTDCFSTFPFPRATDSSREGATAKEGTLLYERRMAIMQDRHIGFTQLYNLIHDPQCVDTEVKALRQTIIELDHSVLELYGLPNICCDRHFEVDKRGRGRFLICQANRDEIIRQLTHLNLEQTIS